MLKEIEDIDKLLQYAEEQSWALKLRRISTKGTDYYFITPVGIHVSIGVDNNGNIVRWSNFQNP